MRMLAPLLLLIASPAVADTGTDQLPIASAPVPAGWNPAAAYVTEGQDQPGYRGWYGAAAHRATYVAAFNSYLASSGVAGVVPTWQLLRTATSWHRCGAEPFEVPPTSEWPKLVQTLRYIRDHVVPVVGPVEAVSVYRNPLLNICAGGVPESSHRHLQAVDLVPLRPIDRGEMMRALCAAHARQGGPYQVGLGFYAFMRFHIDSMKYRKWGADGSPGASPCGAAPVPEQQVAAALSVVAEPAPAAAQPEQK